MSRLKSTLLHFKPKISPLRIPVFKATTMSGFICLGQQASKRPISSFSRNRRRWLFSLKNFTPLTGLVPKNFLQAIALLKMLFKQANWRLILAGETSPALTALNSSICFGVISCRHFPAKNFLSLFILWKSSLPDLALLTLLCNLKYSSEKSSNLIFLLV